MTSDALRKLNDLADQRKRQKHPTVPYLVKSKYRDKSSNDLTKCVVDYLDLIGGWATRINSTGTYRPDIGFTFGNTKKGTADVMGTLPDGRSICVEVKIGRDRQSKYQKKVESEINRANGIYIIAKTFQQFHDDLQSLYPH